MTREEVDIYATRANRYIGTLFGGFRGCTVVSYEPVVMAYEFENNLHAEAFIFSRQLSETKFQLTIDPNDDTRVLEYR
jgi:hypothetical protein